MTAIQWTTLYGLILFINLISEISAFRTQIATSSSSSRIKSNGISTSLPMGLYDTPLPPRPERRNEDDNNGNEDDSSLEVQRLLKVERTTNAATDTATTTDTNELRLYYRNNYYEHQLCIGGDNVY